MGQYSTERKLSTAYVGVVLFGLFTIICTAIPWNHWKFVLDVCPDEDCGCILYGVTANLYFTGGHVSTCNFIVYGTIPIVGVAFVMASFHILRVCINNIGQYENDNSATIEQREGEVIVITTRAKVQDSQDPVSYCWIPASVFGSILAIYSLVVASILTDGYYKTCNKYRGDLIKTTRAAGSQVSVIHSRLSCQAIYDFMDYLQPDVLDRRRGDFINTGVSLQIALVCAWFMFFTWVYIVVLNSMRAHKDKDVSTCCGK